ncbi:MAG TPA: SRPBCC domain-containing protein [Streptosporangiaceae bacterium]|nr:SRPBCC domain-containing protein [Streptosporangiaceae bacterium]
MRTISQSVDVNAPTERVWGLVSTSAGLSAWFVDADVAPGPQGSVTLRFAPGAEGKVPVLAWDPPYRIKFGMPDGGRAHDIAITATDTGCLVRLQDEGVHEAEAESVAAGWSGFLGKLKVLAEANS